RRSLLCLAPRASNCSRVKKQGRFAPPPSRTMMCCKAENCPLRLSSLPAMISFPTKAARQRECPKVLTSLVSDKVGDARTLGKPPARVAKSAQSHSKLLSRNVHTFSHLVH